MKELVLNQINEKINKIQASYSTRLSQDSYATSTIKEVKSTQVKKKGN
jgi:hypothetical protein